MAIKDRINELVNSVEENDMRMFNECIIIILGYKKYNEDMKNMLNKEFPELTRFYEQGNKLKQMERRND